MEKEDTANSFLPHPPATALNNFMPALPCGLLLEPEGKGWSFGPLFLRSSLEVREGLVLRGVSKLVYFSA